MMPVAYDSQIRPVFWARNHEAHDGSNGSLKTGMDRLDKPSRPFKSFFGLDVGRLGGPPPSKKRVNVSQGTCTSLTSNGPQDDLGPEAEPEDDYEEEASAYFDTFDVTSLKDAHGLLMQHVYRPSRLADPVINGGSSTSHIDHASNFHLPQIQAMNKQYGHLHAFWIGLLLQGFHLLFHGYGSKQNILQHILRDAPAIRAQYRVVVLDGNHPELCVDRVLDVLAHGLQLSLTGTRKADRVLSLVNALAAPPSPSNRRLLLLIVNIEALMARHEALQLLVCRLANLAGRRVALVATMDHIQASFAWASSLLDQSRWIFQELVTFIPFAGELYGLEAALKGVASPAANSLSLQLAAAYTVLANLTLSSRKIYGLFLRQALASLSKSLPTLALPSNSQQQQRLQKVQQLQPDIGLSFHQFFLLARDQFLASSETSFRTQIREFLDHKLLLIKTLGLAKSSSGILHASSNDDSDFYHLPFPPVVWQDILDNLEALQ